MTQFFANHTIGARLYAGFGLVLLLAVVQAVMFGVGTSLLSGNFKAYGSMAREALLVSEIGGNMAGLRLAASHFMSTNVDADVENANKAYEKVRHGIEMARKEIQNPVRVKLINEIDALSVAYKKGFEKISDLVYRRNKLVDEQLDETGPYIREKLTGLNEKLTRQGDHLTANLTGTVQEDFLTARLYATKFLNINDSWAIDRVRAEFKEVKQGLESLKSVIVQEHMQALSDVEKELPKHEQAFEELVQVIAELNQIRGQALDANGNAIGEKIAAVKASTHEDANKLQQETEKSTAQGDIQNVVMAITMTMLGALVAWVIGRSIATPVTALTAVMGRLADSDWRTEVAGAERKDELGQMARAVFIFKENGMAAERMQAEQRSEQEKKEARTKQIELDIGAFEQSVATLLEMFASAATELQTTAQSMNAIADEGQRQSSTVAAASEEASVNVQTVAAAGEALSSSIVEINRQVADSARISCKASQHAQKTNDQIKGLAAIASRIGEVISLINDIASHTNLLALNATIEAARAGEAGKGFAVVASEVKNLATQTARATEDISAKIAEMQSATNQSVSAIQIITDTIAQISEINTAVASAVEEQGSATQEIARNVQEAAKGTQEVSSSISNVTQVVSETGAAANQVLSAAEELSRQSEKLQSEVDGFLQKMRAA